MDDEVVGGWVIDPEVRDALRLEKARRAFERGDLRGVVVETEELLDESPDHGEALALLAEATLELGDAEGARSIFEHALETLPPDGALLSGLALARFESCDLHAAAAAARDAIRLEPDRAEAHYTLGLALEHLPGRQGEAISAFAAAQRLDPAAFPFPLQLTGAEWEALAAEGLRRTPEAVATFWRGVPIRFVDTPDLTELRAARPPLPPTVRGLFAGTPPGPTSSPDARPEALRLFRRNLARLADRDAIADAIADVAEREALEWLGVAPEDLGIPPRS